MDLKNDTFISNYAGETNNSELNYLKISRSGDREDRIITKLPTNKDQDEPLKCLDLNHACSIFFLPLVILVDLLTTCSDAILNPNNLTSAILVMNTNDSSDIPAGTLDINLLGRPKFQLPPGLKAGHPFSDRGVWSQPGGDIDSSQSFDSSCTNLSDGVCGTSESEV